MAMPAGFQRMAVSSLWRATEGMPGGIKASRYASADRMGSGVIGGFPGSGASAKAGERNEKRRKREKEIQQGRRPRPKKGTRNLFPFGKQVSCPVKKSRRHGSGDATFVATGVVTLRE
jgi:hypothetical protein